MRLRRLFLILPLLAVSAFAFAASTPSGTVSMKVNLAVAIPAGGDVITAYTVPVQPTQTLTYAAGTAAGQINKVASVGGSAAAAPASIDMTTASCVDNTTGFAHVREVIVFNDSTTNNLTWDFTVANGWVAPFSAGGATAKLTIPPGSNQRFPIPNGTNGWVVDATHKVISLDPGANTVAYRVVLAGD